MSDDTGKRFERLYAEHHAAVLAYCLRRTGPIDAQDLAAEVFTVAWRRMETCPADERIRPWLYGIAYRVIGHHWRSQRRRRRLADRVRGSSNDDVPGPEILVVRRTEDERVAAAARRLSDRDQEILRLAGWEELEHSDIAEILGISVAAVDQRFHRAKRRLAREYDRMDSATRSAGGTRA